MGDKTTKRLTRTPQLMVAGALSAVMLAGCGSGASGDPITDLAGNAGQFVEPLLDPTLPEIANSLPENASSTPTAPVVATVSGSNDPIIAAASSDSDVLFDDSIDGENVENADGIVTLADTGLQVGFSNGLDTARVDLSLIEDSWSGMQSCLNVVAVSPLVMVLDVPVLPMSASDDVLFNIDGSIVATSTRFETGTATVQISIDDLDGSLNRVGFNLRSIMGRYLWDSANLPERDYPHSCASDG